MHRCVPQLCTNGICANPEDSKERTWKTRRIISRRLYRATSIALALVLSLFWLPQQGFELAAPTFTYADGRSVSYPVDYTTSGYALGLTQNGDSLISDSAIQFERKEDGGGSVFTNNKINLGGNLAFSTAFSLDITPPSTLSEGMSGIVFTLQDKGNTAYAKDFQYDIDTITPSLNIAFVTEYSSAGVLMAASENKTAASDFRRSSAHGGRAPA